MAKQEGRQLESGKLQCGSGVPTLWVGSPGAKGVQEECPGLPRDGLPLRPSSAGTVHLKLGLRTEAVTDFSVNGHTCHSWEMVEVHFQSSHLGPSGRETETQKSAMGP